MTTTRLLVELCRKILTQLENYKSKYPKDHGSAKLSTMIKAEAKFLSRLQDMQEGSKEVDVSNHLYSSNLPFLLAIAHTLLKSDSSETSITSEENRVKVLETFSEFDILRKKTPKKSIRVDVIEDQGESWVKIKCLSGPETLTRTLMIAITELMDSDSEMDSDESLTTEEELRHMDCNSGVLKEAILSLEITRQMLSYMDTAKSNRIPKSGKIPRVILRFVSSIGFLEPVEEEDDKKLPIIPNSIINFMNSVGVYVQLQDKIESDAYFLGKVPCPVSEIDQDAKKTNDHKESVQIDITSVIAICSHITNSTLDDIPDVIFSQIPGPLQLQIRNEMKKPFFESVERFLTRKQCVMTESCLLKLADISKDIAGPIERVRAFSLFKKEDLIKYNVFSSFHRGGDPENVHWDKRYVVFGHIQIIPDNPSPCYQLLGLLLGFDITTKDLNMQHASNVKGKIGEDQFKKIHRASNPLNIQVFGTSSRLQIPTVTSNRMFTNTVVENQNFWYSLTRDKDGHVEDVFLKNDLSSMNPSGVLVHDPKSFLEQRLISLLYEKSGQHESQ